MKNSRGGFAAVLVVFLVVAALVGGGIWYYKTHKSPSLGNSPSTPAITSFKDCSAANYPIVKGYPQQCKTSDGTVFTEQVVEGYTLPASIIKADKGTTFDLPVQFQLGRKGTLKMEIVHAGKFEAIDLGGRQGMFVPTCEAVHQTCNTEAVDPQYVENNQSVVSIDLVFKNEDAVESAPIDVANMFRFVYGNRAMEPRGWYAGREISEQEAAAFGPGTFVVPPISSRTHSFLITIPSDTERIMLVAGYDLKTTTVGLSFDFSNQPLSASGLKHAEFQFPYPITWHAGGMAGATFSLAGVTLGPTPAPQNLQKIDKFGNYTPGESVNALTLVVKLKMDNRRDWYGNNPSAPITLQRVVNEEGDTTVPNTNQFYFSDTGGYSGTVGKTYLDQKIIFVVPENQNDFTIITNGDSTSSVAQFGIAIDGNSLKIEDIKFPEVSSSTESKPKGFDVHYKVEVTPTN